MTRRSMPPPQSKAGIDLRVDAGHVQHVGVDHAAAQQFNPAGLGTDVAALCRRMDNLMQTQNWAP